MQQKFKFVLFNKAFFAFNNYNSTFVYVHIHN